MIVVSDTSPIRALAAIELTDLIVPMYGVLLVPPAVAAELAVPVPRFGSVDAAVCGYLSIRAPSNHAQVAELSKSLDPGESEAIALAIEVQASALLIDEQDGRRAAALAGLKVIGVVGVLLEAKAQGRLPAVSPCLERLRAIIDFRLSDRLVREALKSAGEL